MSDPEHDTAPESRAAVDATAARASATLLERLAEKLGGQASAAVVYGEPVTAHGATVIPVARVSVGFGGGVGHPDGDGATGTGGGGADARPVGYIEIRDGFTAYRPIRDPWVDVMVPLAALAVGALLPKAVGTLFPKAARVLRRRT
ncbi:spore germination protein GerW family protein [Streptomyces lincolnensis]|uniref:spore germination protein GerW family protein n=1 Tax=Streptomyces lincolnensis TaxID=1915 RepID=UPI00082981C0|nr:spore germination protein GerW family protein [Streptomyces lincolnensis]QMV10873.1 sporulation protein [Streptomyces lincolnensis]